MTTHTLKVPDLATLQEVAAELGMSIPEKELVQHLQKLEGGFAAYNLLDQMPDEVPEVRYPRTPGKRPAAAENPYGAWYVKTTIEGASTGPLKGKTVAVKDNVCIAGVPMMNGASTLEGYVPDVDATIVTRILDAGGTIAGKTVCEYFCFSGGSHTASSGHVHNPRKPGYSAGGSSSGSAAVVAAGEVPMAIGGDQGGSIRMPASYCGIYGLKPTHGLVPYSGIMPIELTLDHTGPMTATVEDNALLLEVLAGPDGLDPRQYGAKSRPFRDAMRRGAKSLRIGIVEEGFGWPQSMEASDALVREGADRFRGLGATVETVSIPMHRVAGAIWLPVAAEGATMQMMMGNGFGFNWQGLYVTSLLDAHSNWRGRADELSDTLKNTMLLGHYMATRHRGHYYAKAQNLVRRLRAAYDSVLAQYDLLLMPTLPMVATKLPEMTAEPAEIIDRAFEMLPNTSPFDCTHHPAMSLPCGLVDGLPAGLMLVGRMNDEETIYAASAAFEAGVDWKSLKA
ncbi:amidase [Paracraurococcus ruber]|uniref:Asp-tRNA(Asn)/Glu-tRNA(Gln) amidotransferase GatCAB subunit A n=1 Tax=Paracraurococcus ruber TaxID=77675 RepID=A0ABS1CRB4_9PROT|nr:amidase [Paracraurococcus ruber]MBK1656982.1 Asp-tRNA(Asn)/Glu-tRNA(Gln) amidotransferase GatCAB subunit A [Paracraurococcus ruber]TDG34320.1 amidase [Paracraurococcus ruber]